MKCSVKRHQMNRCSPYRLAGGENVTAVTEQADPFCTGKEQRSFRLLGFSLVATERTTTFLSGVERTGML